MNFNNLRTPGVYIDEVDNLPLSVVPVETAIPAFIGYTKRAERVLGKNQTQALNNVPTKIFSMPEFIELFGDNTAAQQHAHLEEDSFTLEITDQNDDAGNLAKRTIKADLDTSTRKKHILYYSLQLYFLNGGGPCYIVSVGDYSSDPILGNVTTGLLGGLESLETEEGPTLIVIPEAIHLSDTDAATLFNKALEQCATGKNRFLITDAKVSSLTNPDPITDLNTFRGLAINNNREFLAVYYPYLETVLDFLYDSDKVIITHNKIKADGTSDGKGEFDTKKLSDVKASNAKLYGDLQEVIAAKSNVLPPSTAIAGVYAQVDRAVGVWKAPANVGLNGVVRPTVRINDAIQNGMNLDNDGRSINAIREKYGRVNVVWGARTYDSLSNSWKYINVRRFFIMAETSIKNALVGVVFEPNDANTWVRVRATIENFLTLQWRAGALQGAKPEHAFYVRVGLNQTMTATDILEGRLIVEIGMAVVRPAEFIVLTFMQKLAES